MEPGYVQYPRQVKRELTFDCIGEAWRVFRLAPVPFGLTALFAMLASLIPVLIGMVLMWPWFLQLAEEPDTIDGMLANFGTQLAIQGALYVVILFGYLIAGPFMAAATKMTLTLLRGGSVTAGDVWAGWKDRPGRFMGIAFLVYLGVMIGSMCCYIPGFIWGGLTMFSMAFAWDENLGTLAAMRRSWDSLKASILMASVLYLVLSIIGSLGALACLVGVFVTLPLFYIAQAVLYHDMTRPAPAMAAQPYSAPMANLPTETPRSDDTPPIP